MRKEDVGYGMEKGRYPGFGERKESDVGEEMEIAFLDHEVMGVHYRHSEKTVREKKDTTTAG